MPWYHFEGSGDDELAQKAGKSRRSLFIEAPSSPSAIILFDGECNLCNASIDFVMRNDPKRYFRFGSLQSAVAQAFLISLGHAVEDYSSVVLIEDGRISTASTAALRIAKKLKMPYSLLGIFRIVPRVIRDPIYSFIARNRYRWFGRRKTCRIPTEAETSRFI
jgi:predicted DCC family thiol-disulfide oxidoreductase YuxK